LGCSDPTHSVFESIAEDPDRETLGRLLKAWYAAFGKTPTMVRKAVLEANQLGINVDLKEVLHDIADERGLINNRVLGWWIRRRAGQIVDGLRIVKSPGNGSAERWRIDVLDTDTSVLPVSSVSITDSTEYVGF
jgi:hypothetical protein